MNATTDQAITFGVREPAKGFVLGFHEVLGLVQFTDSRHAAKKFTTEAQARRYVDHFAGNRYGLTAFCEVVRFTVTKRGMKWVPVPVAAPVQ